MNHLVSLKSEEVVVVTDGQVTLLFIVAAALHLFSFFFSGMEVAFPTVNRLRIQKDVENKKKLSKTVLKLAEDFHQVTSIALFGNALVNTTP
jgi:Mg2+/Co2+ transporter CorB